MTRRTVGTAVRLRTALSRHPYISILVSRGVRIPD
jgi:hypothetical protein